jgi:hypothetical protein
MQFSSLAHHDKLIHALMKDEVALVHSIMEDNRDMVPSPHIFEHARSIKALQVLFRYYKPTGRQNLGWRPIITNDNILQHKLNCLLLDLPKNMTIIGLDNVKKYICLVLDQGANPNEGVCTNTNYDIARGSYFVQKFKSNAYSPSELVALTVMVEYGGADVNDTWGECGEYSIGTRLWQFLDFLHYRELLVPRLDFIDACVKRGFKLPLYYKNIRHEMIIISLNINTIGPYLWLCAMLRSKNKCNLPNDILRRLWPFLIN